jgi:hypothetical protein
MGFQDFPWPSPASVVTAKEGVVSGWGDKEERKGQRREDRRSRARNSHSSVSAGFGSRTPSGSSPTPPPVHFTPSLDDLQHLTLCRCCGNGHYTVWFGE